MHNKIFIIGNSGRMGGLINQLLPSYLEKDGCNRISNCDDFEGKIKTANVVIDFSNINNLSTAVEACVALNTPYFCGTTGLLEENFLQLKDAANYVPIMYASNTSIGVAIVKKALRVIAKEWGAEADVEISETHHRFKKDAPSGTALSLGEVISDVWGYDLHDIRITDRSKQPRSYQPQIGFSSLRGGNVAGTHEVSFFKDSEVIKISHECLDRKVFALGAIKAALWLQNQTPGFYKIEDMLQE